MAGRGKRLLENLQKARETKESSSDVPQVGQSTASAEQTKAPAGRGRGRIIQSLMSAATHQREVSPPRESSSGSSSSDQPSPSGPVGSSPVEELEKLDIEDDEPIRRSFPRQPEDIRNKERGKDGNQINLSLNYVRLSRQEGKGIYLYDIKFNPLIDSRQLRAKILKQPEVVAQIGTVFQFTGMNIYLPTIFDKLTIETTNPVDGSPMTVRIEFVKEPPFEELIIFYNTTFRKIMRELKLIQIQRHFYDPTARIEIPQHKLEILPGWVTSIQELDDGLLLACDASHRLLRMSTAKEILMELFRLGREKFKDNAMKRLVGSIVLTRYNNKPYRVDDIDFTSNPMSTFEWNGKTVTYVDYFKKSWSLEIKDLKQPLLVNRPKPKKGQTETGLVCLIPEFCYLTGLTDDIRSDTRAMKDIASHTRIPPTVRQQKLQTFIRNVLSTPNARRHLTDWGLDLNPNTYETSGRTMAADKVILGNDNRLAVSFKADWSRDATNNALFHVVNVQKWLIVFTRRDSAKVDDFIKSLKFVTRLMGFTFEDPDKFEAKDDTPMRYVEAIKSAAAPERHQIIVVMTPGSSQREDRYNAIKRLCYCELGLPNQVVRANTLSDAKMRSVCQKIAIQMSCKIGGQPWALPIPFKSCMVVGIDVYHDPTQRGKSVVGMVASVNQSVSHWYSRVFFQNSHEEIVNTLESGIIACLRKYHAVNNGNLPDRIFLYRDGVSDGQLQYVLDFEIPQIQNALQDFGKAYEGYCPKLSVIVVQKRINAKLYLKKGNELANPPPGSVLDHSITRKNYYDFYLISQFVTQGTVTPTHYIVMYDKNDMTPDRMQKLSYKMTHLYYNWFGTIRVPAPCQYAHKAAAMVGQVIKKSPAENLTDKLYFL